MLEKRFVSSLLCLAVVLGFSATATMGDDILFISSLDYAYPGHMTGDDALKTLLEGLGHTVTYLDDDESEAVTEAAAAAADLVFISESCGSQKIKNEITEIETPMVSTSCWSWDEMGLTEGGGAGTDVATTDIEIVEPGHFLAAGLIGTVSVLTDISSVLGTARFGMGITGLEAIVIARATLGDGVTYDVIFVYEKGAALAVPPADGSPQVAADIRVCVGFDFRSYPLWNENAYALFEAAVNFALGLTGPPGKAKKPYPPNGAIDVPRDVVLSWRAGREAAQHDVYLSIDEQTVVDGSAGATTMTETSYGPLSLDFGTTYYWRVDEVNAPPDSTIFKGEVWQFTTEPVAYVIQNITATASSNEVNKGPGNTVNGSGLDDSGLLHDDDDRSMWLSGVAGPQPTWIEFQFDKVYKLHEMWVWNSNQFVEPMVGFAFKDVTIEYSVDGADYATLGTTHEFARAPGTDGYAHNTTVDFSGAVAKYVRLTANSNWGGFLPQYGLSEVRFFQIPMSARNPYPDSGATGVNRAVVLGWKAGREAAKHDVYFSSDQQAVIDGTAYVGTVSEASYGPLSLDWENTYYWRVDEVNYAEIPKTWEGDIWSFSTQESFEDFETDDFSKFPWEHSGDASWAIGSAEKNSGNNSAQAGSIDDDESTTLQVTLDCVSGDITFYRKVSSESGSDYLKFYIDGVRKSRWSGEDDWAEVSFPVAAGTRTFEWTYSKDGSESKGRDTAWIDDIVFPIE